MGIIYNNVSLLFDDFEYLDSSKWGIHGESNGNLVTSNSELTISNTSGNSSLYTGIYSIMSFPVGTVITVKSYDVQGRHASLIGFGSSPYYPFPHAGTSPGFTWYSRADNFSSTLSWRNENGTTGFYDSVTENLTSPQIFKLIRRSSSTIEIYRNNVLEYTATGLVLANSYPVYFSNDGWSNPNITKIDWISVSRINL